MSEQPSQIAPAESRVARKRRVARQRIIDHAEQLMRAHPIENITVGDITQAADIGHGTFYLHFKSKNEVLIPITRGLARRWDDIVQQSFSQDQDPAEVVGLSSRYIGRAVIDDRLWRWMLKHSGMPIDDIRGALGRFAERDFQRGYASGRFQVADIEAVNRFIVGGFVSSLLSGLESTNPDQAIDHMAELLLRTLGIDLNDAARIAHQPLPSLAKPIGEQP